MIRQPVGGRCPLCGANHAACGQPTTVTPVDIPARKERNVGQVRKYHVNENGYDTILKLNDQEAEERGLTDADLVDGAEDDGGLTDADLVDGGTSEKGATQTGAKGRRSPANKARTATNKSGQ